MATINETQGEIPSPKTAKGVAHKAKFQFGAGSAAFFALDAYSRIKDGESVPQALGSSLLTNLVWGLIPGGFAVKAAVMGGMALGELGPLVSQGMTSARQSLAAKGGNFQSSTFVPSQAQSDMLQNGLQNLNNARAYMTPMPGGNNEYNGYARSRMMADHARNAQRVY
jgi:hypothetical protein